VHRSVQVHNAAGAVCVFWAKRGGAGLQLLAVYRVGTVF